jgi:hypothetical protein
VPRRGIDRLRDGSFRVRLTREERDVLAALPGQAHELIDAQDASTARLFPPAHADDAEAESGYRRLVGRGLVDGRLAALAELERTARADRLAPEELESWLGALESLRLVLGTQLDITEESVPDAPRLALYHWLSWLQEEVVQALAAALPGAGDA